MSGIEVRDLTKVFGQVTAVDQLSFIVRPGAVTAFLGPNGAGKTTTMRMMIDHVAPTSGSVSVGGRRYRDIPRPTSVVGAVFDANSFHPHHSARDHLRIYAAMGGYPVSRVQELLDLLGLAEAAGRRTGSFSTGMRQRLNLATALLGDPRVLLLDEPSNGLDPEGMAWLRAFLRGLADEGRTILISSHVLSEVQQIADDVVVIRQGRLVAAGPLRELSGAAQAVHVQTPDRDALSRLLAQHTQVVEADSPHGLRVRGLDAAAIADLAAAHGLRVHGLTSDQPSLEQLFLDLTGERTNA